MDRAALKRSAVEPAGPSTPVGELREAGLHALLGYQIAQAKIATDAVFDRSVGTPHELRPVEYTMLALIAANAGASPSRIATALALNKPNVTLWLGRLEARRLIERRPSAQDGRSIELTVTAAGARLAAEGTAALVEAERLAFDRLSAAERAMLAELLHKLAARR
ncbi:MAG TPA: MarR family transcriptional regulator [Methylibium sp.]|uniref:MarR family winged helix-turn-helix transcriptional regulator n=1 Tax=Methylibium sp. TaxID=2067992 RepID=UPI002DBB6DB6|nr:MarR family transcriptional regulator [Methylibium sp.]HEU4458042.1 MarR family transcriptional regulator [Methylibium sp.]